MNTKRVALFLPSLRGGGAERVMVTLAYAFADQGLRVDLVLAKAEGPYLSKLPDSVRVIDLKVSRVLFGLPFLAHYLRQERPVAMLSAMGHANIVALWACRVARVSTRVVISEHSNLSRSVQNAIVRRQRFLPRLMRYFYPWADGIVAVSKGVAEDLAQSIKLPRERITIIYNPVVTPELLENARESSDHPWFYPGKSPVILGVGRLTKAKNFALLIRAFALVREKRPARLMILGDGEEREELEILAHELGVEKDVEMPGFVHNPYAYMGHAAVFVLSSAWEGFGNVLVEAMACGCPVVSTNCHSGPAEILENGRYGALVPVGDAAALAEAMVAILDDPNPSDVAQLAQDFGVEQAVGGYLKVLLGDERAVAGAGR